ncbi:HAD family phosphatase, partial [archaeon]
MRGLEGMLKGVILDVDGVIVDSPHERAWGETLRELMEGEWKNIAERIGYTPEMYTTQVYDVYVSGKPRREGARALLEYFQVPNIREEMVDRFCEA